ncbi:putative baseplate assembly protein [Paenibacillus thailandensis]|uniref:Baseplate assembly protein n=1 Tax=Paenibacillus thailandensis TaxID=393250 RepID=A0ABW5QXI6_9BACL
MKTPLIDKRSLEDVLRQLRERIPYYTPEWRAEEGDAAGAVMRIFAHLYAGILQRLNRAPDKHFIAFLNMLGVRLIAARPAAVPVTFHLSAGAPGAVLIPAATQLAAPQDGGPPIGFETERSMLAVPARITGVFAVDPHADSIFEAPGEITAGGMPKGSPFALFSGTDSQSHSIYIGDGVRFDITGEVAFELTVTGNSAFEANRAALLARMNWTYLAESGEWLPLEAETSDVIRLRKKERGGLLEHPVNGVTGRWIRGTIPPTAVNDFQNVTIYDVGVRITNNTTRPDYAFVNDVPLDPGAQGGFYPFGRMPRLYDAFYMASRQVFSKKGAKAVVAFKLAHDNPDNLRPEEINAELSWEYWNGSGWLKLNGKFDDLRLPERAVELSFLVPEDIAETTTAGQKGYWIRARIIGGGYGRQQWDPEKSQLIGKYGLPVIREITLSYDDGTETAVPGSILAFNNLEYRDITAAIRERKPAVPFEPMADEHRALYLGFDAPPKNGPVSLYFSLSEQDYLEDNLPYVSWEYFRPANGRSGEGEWIKLDVRDDTRHLTQSGCLSFIGPDDLSAAGRFGKRLYWIRGVDVADKFQPEGSTGAFRSAESGEILLSPGPGGGDCGCGCGCAPSPCGNRVALFETTAVPDGTARAPKLRAVYMNTTMAVQSESVKEETLGSGRGTASESFTLAKSPVFDESVFVNEFNALSEYERQALKANGLYDYREETDDTGAVTAFWVKWKPSDRLDDSGPADRHYEIDRTAGTVRFGDGLRGAMLPAGTDNVIVSYRTGGGARGNVGASAVSLLRTSIAFVDRADNPEPASGGFDTESIEQAALRGPSLIRHRNRAVTAEDYEQIALEAAQGIARVKCLPNRNDAGLTESGWVSIVIVPQSSEPQPLPSAELRRQVEAYLRERASNLLSAPRHIKAIEPAYAEISVTASITAAKIELAAAVELEAASRIKAYLHPLTGGSEGRGWEFGALPCLADFYRILEQVPGVDHVGSLVMTVRDPRSGRSIDLTPDEETGVIALPYMLPYSGKHNLAVTAAIVT